MHRMSTLPIIAKGHLKLSVIKLVITLNLDKLLASEYFNKIAQTKGLH